MNGLIKVLPGKKSLSVYRPMVIMDYWILMIIIIINFYCSNRLGRSFTLASPNLTDIGDPAVKGGIPGMYTKESGFLSFFEVNSDF